MGGRFSGRGGGRARRHAGAWRGGDHRGLWRFPVDERGLPADTQPHLV